MSSARRAPSPGAISCSRATIREATRRVAPRCTPSNLPGVILLDEKESGGPLNQVRILDVPSHIKPEGGDLVARLGRQPNRLRKPCISDDDEFVHDEEIVVSLYLRLRRTCRRNELLRLMPACLDPCPREPLRNGLRLRVGRAQSLGGGAQGSSRWMSTLTSCPGWANRSPRRSRRRLLGVRVPRNLRSQEETRYAEDKWSSFKHSQSWPES